MEQRLNLSKCSASGKTRYPTSGDAKTAIQKLKAKKTAYNSITQKRIKRRNGKAEQCRSYYCPHCKGWHMTSNEAKLNNKGIEKRFYDRISKQPNLILTQNQADDWKADGLPFPEPTKTDK
jgi:hypothetical protein